jgi:hypothetical protein
MKYDVIIIGGGISGLYAAYNLYKNKKILVIERSSELGGRIKTDTIDGFPVDLGAARFSNKHKHFMALLKKLKFQDKFIELPKKIDHYYLNKKINYNTHKSIQKLNLSKKKYNINYLQKITLLQYSKKILGDDESEKLRLMFGYDAEFFKLNTYAALKMFDEDLLKDVTYYILRGGFKQLIDKLEEFLIDKGVTIQKEKNIIDIQNTKIIDENNKEYLFTNLILAIPKVDLKYFEIFKDYNLLDNVSQIPLIRIYAKYPKNKNGKVWFHNMERTITNNFIRHIIPIDYDNGIIMISYSDYHIAEMWNNLYLLGEKELTKKINSEIKKLLNINIPEPLEYNVYFWKEGVHMWKTNTSMDSDYKKIIKPFPKSNIYICNEAYSKHQCWVEGSLKMSKDVANKIIKNKKTIKQTGGKKNKRNMSRNTKKKIKEYSINDVLKNKKWIIFDHSGNKFIYKLTSNWFKNHPGGGANLKKGIEANSYYNKNDPNRSKKSPIQLFKSISVHSRSNVLKDYIINSKPKILKKIGLLK